MRIVVDLQAAQSPGSRIRGIGRYSVLLAEAMARQAGDHEVWIALNHAVADVVDPLRARFAPLVGEERVVVWESLRGIAAQDAGTEARRQAAECLRERFLARLAPDAVHASSLFEGWGDDVATSVGTWPGAPVQAATLYDLIPYVRRDTYLADARVRAWYTSKLRHLSHADQLLAISEFTREEAIRCLGMPPERVANISGACDPLFHCIDADARAAAAARLQAQHGLQSFVLYTGGFDARKNIDGLIRAFAALPEAVRRGRQLAIVGHGPDAEIARLAAIARDLRLGARDVVFTGYVSDDDLRALYNLCDLFVFPSFHEGFGLPALEAMACGAPVIGARASSLPEVIGFEDALFDPDSPREMADLMAACLQDSERMASLRAHAEVQVPRFSWDASATKALAALEAAHARRAPRRPAPGDAASALADDAAAVAASVPADADYAALRRPLAQALARNRMRDDDAPRALFVDVTMLAGTDAGTGIQRVVRNILRELLRAPPAGYVVQPVRMAAHGYVHARAFGARFAGLPDGPDAPVDALPGDVLLGLDLIAHLLPDRREHFRWLRDRGVRLWFVVYDLLPVLRPDFFPEGGLGVFQAWYDAVGEVAEGVACISRAVADELAAWYDQIQPARWRPLRIGHFHLGADLQADAGSDGAIVGERDAATFLMVGTLERRKGHGHVVDAFERLWARGRDVRLVIVGKPGWLVDGLIERLRTHPEAGARLVWREATTDAELRGLYGSASALVMASEGEGFGLPLVEAAQMGLPLIARDLPVFREVAGDAAHYFADDAPDALADAIDAWLRLRDAGAAPQPAGIVPLAWDESARQLWQVVEGTRCDHAWRPGRHYRVTAADPRIATQVGRRERGVLVPGGEAGFLLYGPYARLPRGCYDVHVALRVDGDASGAVLDLVGSEHLAPIHHLALAGQPVHDGRMDLRFRIALSQDADAFQVRLFVPAGDRTAFVHCELAPVDAASDFSIQSKETTEA